MQEQWETLKAKIKGHYAYYGISLNYRSIAEFYLHAQAAWHKWLNRRGWHGSRSWDSFNEFLRRWPLPKPKIVHSFC